MNRTLFSARPRRAPTRALIWTALVVLGSHTSPAPAQTRAALPDAAGLVDARELVPDLIVDIRYATSNNFVGKPVYPAARCLLRRPVAQALAEVARDLRPLGLRLKVWDCYRPFSVQETLWAQVSDPRYVAKPVRKHGRPAQGSKHNRGAAIDLTLVDETGRELDMPTGFDDFSPKAHRGAKTGTAEQARNSRRLEDAMRARGFAPLPTEWWHFDGPDWRGYDLSDEPLAPAQNP